MLFMVIETFRNHDGKAIYERTEGPVGPADAGQAHHREQLGLRRVGGYWDSIMETYDVTRLQRWISEWADLMSFEVVPIVVSKQTAVALGTAV